MDAPAVTDGAEKIDELEKAKEVVDKKIEQDKKDHEKKMKTKILSRSKDMFRTQSEPLDARKGDPVGYGPDMLGIVALLEGCTPRFIIQLHGAPD